MSVRFEIEPAYRDALAAAGLASFDALMNARASDAPTSRHDHRETVPIDVRMAGRLQRFYLKRVFRVPPRHAIVPLFRLQPGFTQPRREWDMLGKLAECDIPAMKRVAVGEERIAGIPRRALLLVESVPYERTIEDWLGNGAGDKQCLPANARRRLFHELGGLAFGIHGKAFRWPDISAKHIFASQVRADDGRMRWEFALIDVERMTFMKDGPGIEVNRSHMPDDSGAFADLRKLYESAVPGLISPTDLRHFWAGYTWNPAKGCEAERRNRKNARLPHGPWLDTSFAAPRLPNDFVHLRTLKYQRKKRAITLESYVNPLAAAGLGDLDAVLAFVGGAKKGKPGLAGHRERIRLMLPAPGDAGEVAAFLKRFRNPPFAEQVRRIFEYSPWRSSADREADFARKLGMLGIPTLRVIACGQRMFGTWELASYIITEEIRGESLESLAARAGTGSDAIPVPRDRHEIIRQLALIARRLHERRIFHRDFYLCHFLLTRNPDGGIVLHLIDLARMIEKPLLRRRWVVKDLAALDYSSPVPFVTRADRLRFLYHYGLRPTDARDKDALRRLIAAVRRRADRMARHDARRGRTTPPVNVR